MYVCLKYIPLTIVPTIYDEHPYEPPEFQATFFLPTVAYNLSPFPRSRENWELIGYTALTMCGWGPEKPASSTSSGPLCRSLSTQPAQPAQPPVAINLVVSDPKCEFSSVLSWRYLCYGVIWSFMASLWELEQTQPKPFIHHLKREIPRYLQKYPTTCTALKKKI